jgi:hypothetical protein
VVRREPRALGRPRRLDDEEGGGGALTRAARRLHSAAVDAASLTGIVACLGCFASVLFVVLAARAAGVADGSPLDPPGQWNAPLLPVLVAGFALYVVAVLAAARRERLLGWVAAAGIATQLAPLAAPLLLTTDARTYAAYGSLAADGRNPYLYASPDNLFPSIYGPLFTAISQALDGLGPDRAQFVFRLVAAACVLTTMALAAQLARRRTLAVALVGLNPLVALHFAGGGHNDALMVAMALGGLVLAQRGRPAAAGAAWAASVFVKWLSGVLYMLAALGRRSRSPELGAFAGTAVCLALGATALYGVDWLRAVVALARSGGRYGSIGLASWLEDAGMAQRERVVAIVLIQLAGLGFLARRAWLGKLRLGFAAALLALLQSWFNPWYALWPLAFAAADDEDGAGRVLAVAMTGYLLLDVAPH